MSASPRLAPHVVDALVRSPARIVVTGAGGWIGRATLELLYNSLGAEAFAERVVAFGSSNRKLELRNGIEVRQAPLDEIAALETRPTLVLHLAFLTKDRVEGMDEADYVRANRALSATVLDKLNAIGTQGVFVASSGAAAFADDPAASVAMRLYGGLKKDDERAFADWAESNQARAVIARIFNLSGPYINKHQNYALASFILDALAGRPIEIRADKRVVRAYVAIRELMSLVFALLLDGRTGVTRFDSGGEAMEMQDIATAVAAQCGPVEIRRPAISAAAADEYVGNNRDYERLLSQYGLFGIPFAAQVAETAAFFAEEEHSGWQPKQSHVSALRAC